MDVTTQNKIDVSIVIAAWNSATFINKAIDSALAQQGVSVEVIVVDDCSSDNTCEVVEQYNSDKVRLIRSEVNGGPGGARNIGFKAAQGEWIAVLDSDDYYLPTRLQEMLASTHQDADILIDNVYEDLGDGKALTPFYSSSELPAGRFTLDFLLSSNNIFTSGKSTGYVKPIFRREFIVEHNIEYWSDVRIGEDYYLLACCLAKGAKAFVLESCAYVYQIRDGSISSKMDLAHFQRLLAADERFMKEFDLANAELNSQQARTENLLRCKNFMLLVDKIKMKQFFSALTFSLTYPRSALLLWLPIKKRLFGN